MHQFLKNPAPLNIKQGSISTFTITLLIVLATVIIPRITLLSNFPVTDEGYYAYQAQLIYNSLFNNNGLPNEGTLSLYPLLGSWVFVLKSNPIILLRIMDLFVAFIASWLFCRIIETESKNWVIGSAISLVFLYAMNQPDFIQNGFKNSIFAAYIPLFAAIRIFQISTNKESMYIWFVIGVSAAIGVLLRETFLPFLFVGWLSILIAYGLRQSLYFFTGSALTGITTVLIFTILRDGDIIRLISAYSEAGIMYAAVQEQRKELFLANGMIAIQQAKFALILCIISIGLLFYYTKKDNSTISIKKLIFWLAVTLIPLLEPISKIGFPYHFSVCLPGIAGLSAYCWKNINPSSLISGTHSIALIISHIVLIGIIFFEIYPIPHFQSQVQATYQNIRTGYWPKDDVEHSNYLLSATAIRNIASSNSTLSISGFMHALYPLTGLLPPSDEVSNLSATLLRTKQDKSQFQKILFKNPPDIVMTTTRTDWPGAAIIAETIEESGLYEKVTVIPNSAENSYGNFGGSIYKKIAD